jgi:hypothetical protein
LGALFSDAGPTQALSATLFWRGTELDLHTSAAELLREDSDRPLGADLALEGIEEDICAGTNATSSTGDATCVPELLHVVENSADCGIWGGASREVWCHVPPALLLEDLDMQPPNEKAGTALRGSAGDGIAALLEAAVLDRTEAQPGKRNRVAAGRC